ncbi:MAG TPA: hypothetical protein VJ574_04795 [Candidatus Bathyarchaeia archaeon]|nr:hypothetical protein [Candidatus Bathyarchaeia archaeon]
MDEKAMERKDREIQDLEKICIDMVRTGTITGPQMTHLGVLFGKRFENAWKAINEGRIKKYVFSPSHRVAWIVVGRERDYQILPIVNYCTCDDFYFRVIDGLTHLCYHLIAQRLAEALDFYEKIEEEDDLYDLLMGEWREFKESS